LQRAIEQQQKEKKQELAAKQEEHDSWILHAGSRNRDNPDDQASRIYTSSAVHAERKVSISGGSGRTTKK